MVYEIASGEAAKRRSGEAAKKKVVQVVLRTMFRLRKEKPEKELKVKIASVDELKQIQRLV